MSSLVYRGSVKNVRAGRAPDELEFEFSDAYSVFDWGRMPDALSGKGESLAAIGAYFFGMLGRVEAWKDLETSPEFRETLAFYSRRDSALAESLRTELSELSSAGLRHHFLERSGANRLKVRKAHVIRPVKARLTSQEFYDYSAMRYATGATTLVPLEVVFRFGVPKGSSFLERATPEYARELGLMWDSIGEGARFEAPVIEFFSKLEGSDRFLAPEQAMNYARLDFPAFARIVRRSILLAVWLKNCFAKVGLEPEGSAGLELWDGKFEWALAVDSNGTSEPVLVDSIGPDELRLVDPATGAQFSKEFLRQFYRKTPWYAEVRSQKKARKNESGDWKERVTSARGGPPALSSEFRAVAESLYPSLALWICGENPGETGVSIAEMRGRIERCLRTIS
ncbi:MAG: hypothetical protein HYW49_11715 [Deltaproteobacteria bacterium]|nr:hypothetical protein [Deltaproteobacteria bacterium]